MKHIKSVDFEAKHRMYVATSVKGDQFVARGVMKACRLARRAVRGQVQYVNNRVFQK